MCCPCSASALWPLCDPCVVLRYVHVQVRGGKLHQFTGGFKSFMSQRAQREAQALSTAAAQAAEIERCGRAMSVDGRIFVRS